MSCQTPRIQMKQTLGPSLKEPPTAAISAVPHGSSLVTSPSESTWTEGVAIIIAAAIILAVLVGTRNEIGVIAQTVVVRPMLAAWNVVHTGVIRLLGATPGGNVGKLHGHHQGKSLLGKLWSSIGSIQKPPLPKGSGSGANHSWFLRSQV